MANMEEAAEILGRYAQDIQERATAAETVLDGIAALNERKLTGFRSGRRVALRQQPSMAWVSLEFAGAWVRYSPRPGKFFVGDLEKDKWVEVEGVVYNRARNAFEGEEKDEEGHPRDVLAVIAEAIVAWMKKGGAPVA